jgi:Xaa-Pro aminopeptidase
VAWGKVSARLARIWKVCKAAQKAAISSIKAGVRASTVDAAARRVIADAGFGEFFGHGLGHGVGLEVHEGPACSPRCSLCLAAGMVVTIEPGIYLPGEGGVRLEDMVLVTSSGAQVLTTLSRDPRALAALRDVRPKRT